MFQIILIFILFISCVMNQAENINAPKVNTFIPYGMTGKLFTGGALYFNNMKRTKGPLCGCGCGKPVKWAYWDRKWNKYIKLHHQHQKGPKHSEETKRKIGDIWRGKHLSVEHKENISKSHKGEKSYLWKGGVTPENLRIRNGLKYRLWRTSVFERDDYTCQSCEVRSGNGKKVVLNADHIKQFAYYPELRFELSNGRTLCVPCHRKKTEEERKGY